MQMFGGRASVGIGGKAPWSDGNKKNSGEYRAREEEMKSESWGWGK